MNDIVNDVTTKIIDIKKGQYYKSVLNPKEIKFIQEYTKNIEGNIDFNTRIFYTINKRPTNVCCYNCGAPIYKNIKPVKYYKSKDKTINNDINIYLCDNCNPKHYCKQSYKTRAIRFANLEKDSIKKQQILKIGENFYNDEFINNWAIQFKNNVGRRPTKTEFENYFGRKFPRKSFHRNFDKTLFDLWDSYFELTVCDYLNELGYTEKRTVIDCIATTDYVRNSMFSLDKKTYYQIDIYFPLLNIGFEIQDFATHSKNRDDEPYVQRANSFKHGPTYHNAKMSAAKNIGITIIELWEDEIKNNKYKKIIDTLLCQTI